MTYQKENAFLDNIMKKINISEEKLKKVLREVFKEQILNGPNPDNHNPLDPPDDSSDMGVGDDGTLEHNVGIEHPEETRDKNLYPGFNEMV